MTTGVSVHDRPRQGMGRSSFLPANNFDLIRLAAALQVVLHHAASHLGFQDAILVRVLDFLPGVPVFFFISGFLISRSFEVNPVLRGYATNRLLRVYPALYVCFGISLLSVWVSGYFRTVTEPASGIMQWAMAQLSVLQFYNPDFMRGYGVGVLNGSLWAISVELQFYCLVPLLYVMSGMTSLSRVRANVFLVVLIAMFLFLNQGYEAAAASHSETLWHKVIGVPFVPWFYMFLIGILFQRNHDFLIERLRGRFIPVVGFYCMLAVFGRHFLGWSPGNAINPPLFMALCLLIFFAAFSRPEWSDRLLRKNDLSYGVYIYHMPAINFLLVAGFFGTLVGLLLAVLSTVVLAYISWRVVEKPALSLKRHALYARQSGKG